MEGCLYRRCDKYYLINTIATYNYIAVEFDTFISCFIQNENFDIKYAIEIEYLDLNNSFIVISSDSIQ